MTVSCEHKHTNANGCIDCGAPWCVGCRSHHLTGRPMFMGFQEPDPWPCIEKMRARVEELETAIRLSLTERLTAFTAWERLRNVLGPIVDPAANPGGTGDTPRVQTEGVLARTPASAEIIGPPDSPRTSEACILDAAPSIVCSRGAAGCALRHDPRMNEALHTCVSTATTTDGSIPPPCPACGHRFGVLKALEVTTTVARPITFDEEGETGISPEWVECPHVPECWGWPECGHEPEPQRTTEAVTRKLDRFTVEACIRRLGQGGVNNGLRMTPTEMLQDLIKYGACTDYPVHNETDVASLARYAREIADVPGLAQDVLTQRAHQYLIAAYRRGCESVARSETARRATAYARQCTSCKDIEGLSAKGQCFGGGLHAWEYVPMVTGSNGGEG